MPNFRIEKATPDNLSLIVSFVKELADYEGLSEEVVATERSLHQYLFGERAVAEAIIGYYQDAAISFAVFFHNFSTFLGTPGIYLEDLYVKPTMRGRGFGRAMLSYLARLAIERGCGRLEWCVLDWNEPAIRFYEGLGAAALDRLTVFRLTGEALEKLGTRG